MLVFPNYAKNYASAIDKGLVIDKGLRLATPLGKRPSLELHISHAGYYILAQTRLNYSSFLKMVDPNNVCLCVGAGYCSLLCSFRV